VVAACLAIDEVAFQVEVLCMLAWTEANLCSVFICRKRSIALTGLPDRALLMTAR
jgi:hypothetical protein